MGHGLQDVDYPVHTDLCLTLKKKAQGARQVLPVSEGGSEKDCSGVGIGLFFCPTRCLGHHCGLPHQLGRGASMGLLS